MDCGQRVNMTGKTQAALDRIMGHIAQAALQPLDGKRPLYSELREQVKDVLCDFGMDVAQTAARQVAGACDCTVRVTRP